MATKSYFKNKGTPYYASVMSFGERGFACGVESGRISSVGIIVTERQQTGPFGKEHRLRQQ